MAQLITTYNAGAMAHAPIAEIRAGVVDGFVLDDHFHNFAHTTVADTTQWNLTVGTNMTHTCGSTGTGTLIFNTGDTGKSGSANSNYPVLPALVAGQKVFFQVRFKISDLAATSGACFFGFRDAIGTGTAIGVDTAAALNGTDDLIGISVTTAGVVKGVSQEGSTTDPTAVTMGTLVANTFATVGFTIDGTDDVKFYYNGVYKGGWTSSAGLPNEALFIELGYIAHTAFKAVTIDRAIVVVQYS